MNQTNPPTAITPNTQAKFISFEGTEGVGKTTAIDNLCQELDKHNIAFIRTREPGGSVLAEELRDIFLDKNRTIDATTELLMMFTARADHLHQTILPALSQDKWVICDRFVDSTVAYQGFGRFLGDETYLNHIQLLTTHFVPRLPDLTLWLDLDIALGIKRANKRSSADRLESQELAFFERVHQGFVYQHHASPKRIHRIDASGTPQDVANQIWQCISHTFLTHQTHHTP